MHERFTTPLKKYKEEKFEKATHSAFFQSGELLCEKKLRHTHIIMWTKKLPPIFSESHISKRLSAVGTELMPHHHWEISTAYLWVPICIADQKGFLGSTSKNATK